MAERQVNNVELFCSQLWDALFDAVAKTRCLGAIEKRVLQHLWAEGTVGSWTCEDYPGHAEFARRLKISRQRLESALAKLEYKGFVKATWSGSQADEICYLLNPLLVEDAYQRVKRFKSA
jgi:DNA-binding MarR family transcriptional regulator